MRIYIILLSILLLSSCSRNDDNNKSLTYDNLEVNFSADIQDYDCVDDTEIGIIATCNRNGANDVSMGPKNIMSYVTKSVGGTNLLYKKSDSDGVMAKREDSNFKFYAVMPVPETSDVTSLSLKVEKVQNYSTNNFTNKVFVSSISSVSVLPVLNFSMKNVFSVLRLHISNELFDGSDNVLKSLSIYTEDSNDDTKLSGDVKYNLNDNTYTLSDNTYNDVNVDFGDAGLPLIGSYTDVDVSVLPFTVPQTGLCVKLTNSNNDEEVVHILSTEKEVGKDIASGEIKSVYVVKEDDGIIPCTFPVVFPLGSNAGELAPTTTSQPQWKPDGIFYCSSQPQAYAEWKWGDEISNFSIKPFREFAISAKLKLSGYGIKGIWTGDYLEFTVPVRNLESNSKISLNIPICAKNAPIFWEVLYLDGKEWKTTATEEIVAEDGVTKRKATWAIPYDSSPLLKTTMLFENAIKSGLIKIRMRCVDGSLTLSGHGVLKVLTKPAVNNAGTAYSGNFYFIEKGSDGVGVDNQSITINKE